MREQDYKAQSFQYSCPQWRVTQDNKKSPNKNQTNKQGKRISEVKAERSKKIGANFCSDSNSHDNDYPKSKNRTFENDVNMADEEMQEDFYILHKNESSQKDSQESHRKHYSTEIKEGKRNNRTNK